MAYGETYGNAELMIAKAIISALRKEFSQENPLPVTGQGSSGGGGITEQQLISAINSSQVLDEIEPLITTIAEAIGAQSDLPPSLIEQIGMFPHSLMSLIRRIAIDLANTDIRLNTLSENLGGINSPKATTDTGIFSVISLFKRLLADKLPDVIGSSIPVIPYRPNIIEVPVIRTNLSVGSTVTTKSSLLTRTKALITNTGQNPVYVDVSPGLTISSYAFLINPKNTITDQNHTGIYYFRCAADQPTTVEIREWQ